LVFLKEAEGGAKPKDICRQHGFSEHSFYRWKAKYGGLDVSQAQEKVDSKRRTVVFARSSPSRRSTTWP
jgi:hypothetical protein